MQGGDEINEEVYCLTNVPNSGASSLCAVGYYCAWMPDLISDSDPQAAEKRARAPQAYALMRQFLGSGSPAVAADPVKGIAARAAVAGLFDRFRAASGRSVCTFKDVFERLAPPQIPSPQTPLAAATELCSYVWDLQFRTPATLQSAPGAPPLPLPFGYPATPPYNTVLPAYVEIRFKALSAAAARQLEGNGAVNRQTWNSSSTVSTPYRNIIQPGTRQFVARVPVLGLNNAAATPAPTP